MPDSCNDSVFSLISPVNMNEATIRPENLRLRSHRNQAFFFFLITLLIYFPPPTVSENQITTTDLFIDNNNMSK